MYVMLYNSQHFTGAVKMDLISDSPLALERSHALIVNQSNGFYSP